MPHEPITRQIDDNGLVDINTVEIDASLPIEERVQQYVEQVKTPYRFRAGKVIVNIEHKNNGLKLDRALSAYLASISSK